ncbi:hypothetical protein AVEN_82647-1 [Araneus ventricosus]|uniref:Uncharacterized protein n=1 Tax=Araneus ventricosus TaxID=182803 RepID=A0A4Y2KVP9_ARAVE|nr:hypothetical protein AVEN_82647-1 [Araneus ventricosus]
MELLQNINTWFWNDYVWLPPNVTWEDLSNTGTVNYAQFSDLYYAFKVALALLVVRYFLEQFLFAPVGRYLGLKPRVVRETDNVILEKAFSENGKIGYKQVSFHV